jgi:hypothetical protein
MTFGRDKGSIDGKYVIPVSASCGKQVATRR